MEDNNRERQMEKEEESKTEGAIELLDIASDQGSKDASSKNVNYIFEILAASDYVQDRLICAKSIMEQFQIAESKEELLSVISRMCKLGDDEEPEVRSELLYSLPYVALFCKDHSEDLNAIIRQQVVPYTVKLLQDEQITVRKFGHSSLKVLIENKILDNSQLKDWICPLLSELVMFTGAAEDLRSEDVSVMCKVVPYIEKDVTEKFFLSPFVSLCCDSSLTIRKVCAVNFSSFCEALGVEITERSLLPAFFNLCSDEVWGVRKECANVFADVAKSVSLMIRKEILPDYFISLLNDESHYVKLAAYQSLGELIATYADTEQKMYSVNTDISLDQKNKTHATETDLQKSEINYNEMRSDFIHLSLNKNAVQKDAVYIRNLKETDFKNVCNKEYKTVNSNRSSLDHNDNFYNNFQYWRTPLPEIESELGVEPNLCSSFPSSSNHQSLLSANNRSNENISKEVAKTVFDQDIVPPALLLSFIYGIKENNDFISVLAYNFCAVAYTLGKKHWSCIRDVYFALASDMNESVRATVASFLHELAAILGTNITLLDLLPVSLALTNDIDVVRVKLLTYLSRFLEHLKPTERRLFLPFIRELLDADLERNWRFRLAVVEQLLPCVSLFGLSEVDSHFLPVSLTFMNDRASAVRRSAIKLFCVIIKLFLQHAGSVYHNKALSLLDDIEATTQSNKWLQRQKYVYICQELATEGSLSEELFIEKIVPNLLSLASDLVPNVRLAVARCLCLTLFPLGYYLSIRKTHHQHLFNVLDALQNDSDWDVRYFFRLCKEDYVVFKQDMDVSKSNPDQY